MALCCALMVIAVCRVAAAQGKWRFPGTGSTSSINLSTSLTDMDDKSRLVQTTTDANKVWDNLRMSAHELAKVLPEIAELLDRPRDKADFLDKLNRLDFLLPFIRPPLQTLEDTLSRFERKQIPVPYRVALYPSVQFRADANSFLLIAGATFSDDVAALDVTAQYLRVDTPDDGFGLVLRHDLTPEKHRASLAVRGFGQEIRRLSGMDNRAIGRLITAIHELSRAVGRLNQLIQPLHMEILQLELLVEERGEDPTQFEMLANRYETLVSPFGAAVDEGLDVFGVDGTEFDRFFTPFDTYLQEARSALVRSALAPHLALTGGLRSFRHGGRWNNVGIALSKQIPLRLTGGVFCNLSGQYVWSDSADDQETSGMLWGVMVAWMDRLSSFDGQGEPILRRWQWQAGFEYSLPSGLAGSSYGAFVRYRPASQLWDYSLFWTHSADEGDEFGISVRTVWGIERY